MAAALLAGCGGPMDPPDGAPDRSICDGAWSFAASLVSDTVPCAPASCHVRERAFECDREVGGAVILAAYEPIDERSGRVCATFDAASCTPCVPSSCVVLPGGVVCSPGCADDGRTCYQIGLTGMEYEGLCSP